MRSKVVKALLVIFPIFVLFCFFIYLYFYIQYKNLFIEKDIISINEINQMMSNLNIDVYDDIEIIRKESEEEIKLLNSEYIELKNNRDNLITLIPNNKLKYIELRKEYDELLYDSTGNIKYLISGVGTINQNKLGYPTGCEIASLTVLLNYWDVNVSIGDIYKNLPRGNVPYVKNGIYYGGNPNVEFVGNPKSSGGYGVYASGIYNVANMFKENIINATGTNFNDILDIVRNGHPVLIWATIDLKESHISSKWIYKETNEEINWKVNEHALVLVGFDEIYVYVSDPLKNKIVKYNKNLFEQRYNYMGKMALYY